MADISQRRTAQGLDCRVIALASGESVTIHFKEIVAWGSGGISWTIDGAEDADYEVKVEHSLTPEGDNWVEDSESPFDEPSQGVEEFRIERIRFTNTGANVEIVVMSPAKMDVT